MASGNLFEFLYSPSISPIACTECGCNMHCVRRSPQEDGERQIFMCANCGESKERIAGGRVSGGKASEPAEAASHVFAENC